MCQLLPLLFTDCLVEKFLFEKVHRSQISVLRSDEVAVSVVKLVCNVGSLAAEPHSMDRRLHDVVRRDVVVARQRHARRLHRDPADRSHLLTLD